MKKKIFIAAIALLAVFMIVVVAGVLAVVSVLAPDDDQFVVADVGKNEDPAITIASDGLPYLVWFSDRGGNADIWLTKFDGGMWSEPVQITTDPAPEFYPTMVQDGDGLFHLVWFKTGGLNFEIMYSSSSDAEEWSAPLQITDDPGVDWTPTIVEYGDDIFVAWASARDGDKDIFVHRIGGETTQVTNDENADDFPFIFEMDGKLAMVWNDHDGTASDLFPTPGSPIVMSTSEDGVDWEDPTVLVEDAGKVSMLPSVHTRDGEYFLTWTSDKKDIFGDIVEAPLSDPANARRLTSNFYPDYSGRVAGDILVWVGDPKRNGQDLHIFYKIME